MRYRHEQKYFLNPHTAAVLKSRITAVMRPDTHAAGGVYTVNNVYFDDMYDTAYQSKQRGSFKREKYRIRYYNGSKDFVKLEHKVKHGLLSYKESVNLTAEQCDRMCGGDFGFVLASDDPILEKFAVLHRLHTMRPSVAYTYLREAYTYETGNVRITFDSQIGDDLPGIASFAKDGPLSAGMLEVKFDSFLPAAVSSMLGGLPLVYTEISKYCYVLEHKRRMNPYA
jgi:hypothetical protein